MKEILIGEALSLVEDVMNDHELTKDEKIIKLTRACALFESTILFLTEEIENIKPLWTVHDG
jgi:hypothetical protein